MALDYLSSIPLHVQLKEKIEHAIFTKRYFGKIPSERELMDEYYVSRSTVRQAISQLVREGVLQKKHGKGTFVTLKPVQDWLGHLSSTNETIQKMGMLAGAKLIDIKIVESDVLLKKITGHNSLYCFKRIRFASDTPLGIEENYYPFSIGEKLNNYDLGKEAFYDLVEKNLGIQILEADQVIKAGKANKEVARLLDIPMGSVLLVTERTLVDSNGNFIEYERAIYRSDMYEFKLKLSRKN